MLESSEERVRLLKAGVQGKDIEKLYIIHNNFKIIGIPLLFRFSGIDTEERESSFADQETSNG